MKKFILGSLLALVILISPAFMHPAEAAALTASQISAIIGLLQAFGADQSVINNVQTSLGGSTSVTPGMTDSNGIYHFPAPTHQQVTLPEFTGGPKSFAPTMSCTVMDLDDPVHVVAGEQYRPSSGLWVDRATNNMKTALDAGKPAVAAYGGKNLLWVLPQHGCISVKFTTGNKLAIMQFVTEMATIAPLKEYFFNLSRYPGDFDYTNIMGNTGGLSGAVGSFVYAVGNPLGVADPAPSSTTPHLEPKTTYYLNIRNEVVTTNPADTEGQAMKGIDSCSYKLPDGTPVSGCGGLFQARYTEEYKDSSGKVVEGGPELPPSDGTGGSCKAANAQGIPYNSSLPLAPMTKWSAADLYTYWKSLPIASSGRPCLQVDMVSNWYTLTNHLALGTLILNGTFNGDQNAFNVWINTNSNNGGYCAGGNNQQLDQSTGIGTTVNDTSVYPTTGIPRTVSCVATGNAPTATLTINGQTSVTDVDPLSARTWTWSASPTSATASASLVISGCVNTTQNGTTNPWTPWASGSGSATNGSTAPIPGSSVYYGCTIAATYVATNAGQTATVHATVTFKRAPTSSSAYTCPNGQIVNSVSECSVASVLVDPGANPTSGYKWAQVAGNFSPMPQACSNVYASAPAVGGACTAGAVCSSSSGSVYSCQSTTAARIIYSGKIVDGQGSPISGVTIAVFKMGPSTFEVDATTAADGTWVIDSPYQIEYDTASMSKTGYQVQRNSAGMSVNVFKSAGGNQGTWVMLAAGQASGLLMLPSSGTFDISQQSPATITFTLSGATQGDLQACYEVDTHPNAGTNSGACNNSANFGDFNGNADWVWSGSNLVGTFPYTAAQWGAAGIQTKSVFRKKSAPGMQTSATITTTGTATSVSSMSAALHIASISPTSGMAGTTVTINGSGFTGTNQIYLDGIPVDTYTTSGGPTPSWVSFVVPAYLPSCPSYMRPPFCTNGPALQAGTHSVSVRNANGASNAVSLGVN